MGDITGLAGFEGTADRRKGGRTGRSSPQEDFSGFGAGAGLQNERGRGGAGQEGGRVRRRDLELEEGRRQADVQHHLPRTNSWERGARGERRGSKRKRWLERREERQPNVQLQAFHAPANFLQIPTNSHQFPCPSCPMSNLQSAPSVCLPILWLAVSDDISIVQSAFHLFTISFQSLSGVSVGPLT